MPSTHGELVERGASGDGQEGGGAEGELRRGRVTSCLNCGCVRTLVSKYGLVFLLGGLWTRNRKVWLEASVAVHSRRVGL